MLKWLKKIPYFEALRAFLEQWGIWSWIAAGFALLGGAAMTGLVWLSNQPNWLAILIGMCAITALLMAFYAMFGILEKRKRIEMYEKVVRIDREALADDLEDLARDISGVATEYAGQIQEAFWSETLSGSGAIPGRSAQARAEGRMIAAFGAKYQAKAYILIRRASKVVPIEAGMHWRIQHGVRSEHDLATLTIFLSQLSDDVRNPTKPIPMYEPRRVPKKVEDQKLEQQPDTPA